MTTQQRATAIAEALKSCGTLWQATSEELCRWVEIELGNATALDAWFESGGQQSRAQPLSPLLHILSRNTPEAAIQSLSRGLLLGGDTQWVKIPSEGDDSEIRRFIDALPQALACRITCSRSLEPEWLSEAQAVVAFGSDQSIAEIRQQLSPHQHLQAHGHKLSCAVWFEMPPPELVQRFLLQVALYQQLGCLSPHQVFLAPKLWDQRQSIGDALSQALQQLEVEQPRAAIDDFTATSIQHARTRARLQAALEPDQCQLWESDLSTSWTLVSNASPLLQAGPGHRFLTLSPLPATAKELGPELPYLSSVGIYPADLQHADQLDPWQAPRLCRIDQFQHPLPNWHHDGIACLSDLVRWQDRCLLP